MQPSLFRTDPPFDGETFEPEQDQKRLGRQLTSVQALMSDGTWRTLDMISNATGAPPASVSARLRDLRKPKFGSWTVKRMRVNGGLFAYRVIALDSDAQKE